MSSNNSKELSSKEAGELLGYTHDYISRLCRTGQMNGVRRGREWFVTQQDIDTFKKRHEVFLQEKKKELSQKLSKIRKEHEAKKRQEKASVLISNNTTHTDTDDSVKKLTIESDTPTIRFYVPKKLIAACVLALILVLPSVITIPSSVQNNTTASVSDSLSFGGILTKGMTQYGYELGTISNQTINVWKNIGNSYLLLYMYQGYAINSSFKDVAYVGNGVLDGYQLLGASFVLGFQNLVDTTTAVFGEITDTVKKKLSKFILDTQEGYVYVFDVLQETVQTYAFTYVISGFQLLGKNIQTNVDSMYSLLTDTKNQATSLISNSINAANLNKDSRVDSVIKIE